MTPLAGAVLTPPRLLLAGDDVADWPALGAHVADTFALPGGSERLASIDEIDRALRDGPSARRSYFAARPERALLAGPGDDLDATLDSCRNSQIVVLKNNILQAAYSDKPEKPGIFIWSRIELICYKYLIPIIGSIIILYQSLNLIRLQMPPARFRLADCLFRW